MCNEMGAMTTSWIMKECTNIVMIVVEFVDGLFHEGFSLFDTIVGLPVTTNESFISGEKVSQQ